MAKVLLDMAISLDGLVGGQTGADWQLSRTRVIDGTNVTHLRYGVDGPPEKELAPELIFTQRAGGGRGTDP